MGCLVLLPAEAGGGGRRWVEEEPARSRRQGCVWRGELAPAALLPCGHPTPGASAQELPLPSLKCAPGQELWATDPNKLSRLPPGNFPPGNCAAQGNPTPKPPGAVQGLQEGEGRAARRGCTGCGSEGTPVSVFVLGPAACQQPLDGWLLPPPLCPLLGQYPAAGAKGVSDSLRKAPETKASIWGSWAGSSGPHSARKPRHPGPHDSPVCRRRHGRSEAAVPQVGSRPLSLGRVPGSAQRHGHWPHAAPRLPASVTAQWAGRARRAVEGPRGSAWPVPQGLPAWPGLLLQLQSRPLSPSLLACDLSMASRHSQASSGICVIPQWVQGLD